ncbi:hypothetical protein [Nonomuraea dietziae]|uniref:hypothetical protein n=1 Tax=Nonomuraea dietziae TaxID=65515 RepID=UPI003448EEC4
MVHLTECQSAAYLDDTYLTAVTTTVAATGRQDDGAAWVAVRRNIFHPQGGGQPADRGWLDTCEVTPLRDAATGLVVVRARDEQGAGLEGLTEGDEVQARVDTELRLSHAALHTAGHLIEAAGRSRGWVLAGNTHFPGQARIEFTAQETDTGLADPQGRQEAAAHLLRWVTAKVADDLPVTVDHDADGLRIVRLGDVHAAPCGGTHVRGLADLAEVTISAVKVKKGRVRVSYSAAHGPLR